MPTADRRAFVPRAIRQFLEQDYPERELVVLDDGRDAVGDLIPSDSRIRYLRLPQRLILGEKRNLAVREAQGGLLAHWDDDDWMAPWRLRYQVERLLASGADLCGLDRVWFMDEESQHAWQYVYPRDQRRWVCGGTLTYRRAFALRNPFPKVKQGEDTRFVWADASARFEVLENPDFYVARVHRKNTSPKATAGAFWHPVAWTRVQDVMGSPAAPVRVAPVVAETQALVRKPVLVAAGGGVGDILRMTPLIRALAQLGHPVDVLLTPDYPGTATLLEGAPEIRRLRVLAGKRGSLPSDFLTSPYDWAFSNALTGGVANVVKSERRQTFDLAEWRALGDSVCVERMARLAGWTGPMPEPFARASDRDFQLPAGTVALHPGCKRTWPWKKWHGFAELAERLEHVVVVGTPEDRDVTGTYFGKPFAWPEHVRDFTGQLDLRDTAALLRQCAALISNDSGLLHLGAAVGTPTWGIFGLTSPGRELMPSSRAQAIEKHLPCEAACRQQPWGRRNCEHQLECLKKLSVEDVMAAMKLAVPQRSGFTIFPARSDPRSRRVERVTVAARVSGGLGDVLLAGALLRDLFAELKDCEIDVFHHSPDAAREVLQGARFVRSVRSQAEFGAARLRGDLVVEITQFVRLECRQPARLEAICPGFVARQAECVRRLENYRGLVQAHPQLDGLWGRICVQEGRNRRTGPRYLAGLPEDDELFAAPDLRGYRFFEEQLATRGAYVTVHDGFDTTQGLAPGTATKCWPLQHWEELVAQIHREQPGILVVQLGSRTSRPIPGVDLNLVGRTTLAESAWVLKNARAHVDGDSGLVHLARALHVPAVVLFGPTDHEFFGYRENQNLCPSGCRNCWWSTPTWLARCPRGLAEPECLASILPDRVLAALAPMLERSTVMRITPEAGRLYDTATRQRFAAVLEDLFRRLELPPVPISQHSQSADSGLYLHASKQWEYLFAWEQLQRAEGGSLAGLKVADVGGGRGALAPYLAGCGASVDSFDLDYLWDSAGDPEVEGRFLRWAEAHGVRSRFASLFNLPVPDATYDVVTCISVVEHVPFKRAALREALRVLKPGGRLILTFDFSATPERHQDALRCEIFSPESLAATLRELASVWEFSEESLTQSLREIQNDRVLGIPEGMTVGGLVLRREG
ncbi:MAG: glycosyltransferase [Verrucomicrobia bacterium]|nr:glycosyltransferase [Verrucomicrobiota bacterium]